MKNGRGRNGESEIVGKAYDARLVKRLWGYVGDQQRKLIIALVLLLLGAVAQLFGPYLTMIAIDRYISARDWEGLVRIVLLFAGISAAAAVLRWSETYLANEAGQIIVYRLRMEVFAKLQRLSIPFFDRNPVGRLMTRVTSDVQALYELFTAGVVAIFGDLFMLAGIIGAMLFINWKLALLTLSVLPLLIVVTFVFKKKVRELYRQTRLKIASLNSYLQENITGMRIVQLFGREKRNYERFDEIGSDLKNTYIKTVLQYSVFFPMVELISSVAVVLIIFGGGSMMLSGFVTVGILVAFIQYVERFYRPLRDLAEKYNILQGAMASSERIFRLLDHTIEIPEPEADKPVKLELAATGGISVEFRNVWFAYRDEDWVLKDVSFKVDPGESIAIVGATGSGKTTMISLLLRYYDVQRGRILVDGVDVREYDLKSLRSRLGIVLQDVFIFAGNIRDNIRYGCPDAENGMVEQAAAIVNADRFIRKLPQGFDEPVTERGSTFSTGQRQLLAFARALICDPPMLILDEATASIDTQTEQLIQKAIFKLLTGRTSLIIAHRLSTIKSCGRILVMHHGRLREEGSHAELLSMRGIYYKLYQLQFSRAAS